MDLARLVREDRERRGESVASQARRLGVARGTLMSLERGGDVRVSILAHLLRAFPRLAPSQLLDVGSRAPPASRALTLAVAKATGVMVERLELVIRVGASSTRREVTTVLRSKRLEDPAARVALLRAIVPGPGQAAAALAKQLATTTRATHEADGVAHEVRLGGARLEHVQRDEVPRALEPVTAATPGDALAAGLALLVSMPSRRVVLSFAGLPRDVRIEACAWLAPANDEGPSLAEAHPEIVRMRRTVARTTIALDWPVVGMNVGACVVRGTAPRVRPPSGLIAAARARAGLTTRELGRRAGVSAMAISKIEHGGDTRARTARAILAALPKLSPWSLLPPAPGTALSLAAAWRHGLDLFGFLSEEEWKLMIIDADGNTSLRIGTRGLRRLRGSGVLRVGLGKEPPGTQPSGARLREVHADGRARSMRIGSAAGADGERYQQIEIPADVAASPVSFERVLLNAGVFTMTRARAFAGATPTPEPLYEGTTFSPLLPCETLVLEVRWPRGWKPIGVRQHCWPKWQPPDPSTRDIADAPRAELDVDERRRRMTLRVRHPLIGTKHALSWALP